MGLGGYLMWTPLAREIYNRTGIKCLPIESSQGGKFIKLIESEIFHNNPHFVQSFSEKNPSFPLVLNNQDVNYCKSDTPERAVHRYDKHVIDQICEYYGINDTKLKCDLFLTEEELDFGRNLRKKIGKDFISIEPHTKDQYTVNKTYPFKKWQYVVNQISKTIPIVQVGQKTDNILKDCIDMTGNTSFREAASIISFSSLFVGPEGGLMHAAHAVEVESIVVVTGFLHPKMTCYPENTNLWIGKNHGPCGFKIPCKLCAKDAEDHDPDEIVEAIKKRLYK